jgi:hypothetical protein
MFPIQKAVMLLVLCYSVICCVTVVVSGLIFGVLNIQAERYVFLLLFTTGAPHDDTSDKKSSHIAHIFGRFVTEWLWRALLY